MKNIILSCLSLFIVTVISAQVTLTLQVPESGVLLKPQLWSAVITNSYPESKRVSLGLTLSNASTGEPVLTATSPAVELVAGPTLITESNISPISYDYLSSEITDRNPEGYLPAGSYVACYTVYLIDEKTTPVTEQCIPVVIEPVSPPILNIPFNDEVIHSAYPQFSWTPPAPLEIFSDLSYDFILVQVSGGQNPADAIQQNLPLYTTNTADVFLNYPSSLSALDTGKIYAWQVTAKNNLEFAAQSDIWTFSIADTSFQYNKSNLNQYSKLKRVLDASVSAAINNLLVYYDNDEDSAASYSIYSIDPSSSGDSTLQTVNSGVLPLKHGTNLISIPLNTISGIADGKQYLFQLYSVDGGIWSLKFIYYKKQ